MNAHEQKIFVAGCAWSEYKKARRSLEAYMHRLFGDYNQILYYKLRWQLSALRSNENIARRRYLHLFYDYDKLRTAVKHALQRSRCN